MSTPFVFSSYWSRFQYKENNICPRCNDTDTSCNTGPSQQKLNMRRKTYILNNPPNTFKIKNKDTFKKLLAKSKYSHISNAKLFDIAVQNETKYCIRQNPDKITTLASQSDVGGNKNFPYTINSAPLTLLSSVNYKIYSGGTKYPQKKMETW